MLSKYLLLHLPLSFSFCPPYHHYHLMSRIYFPSLCSRLFSVSSKAVTELPEVPLLFLKALCVCARGFLFLIVRFFRGLFAGVSCRGSRCICATWSSSMVLWWSKRKKNKRHKQKRKTCVAGQREQADYPAYVYNIKTISHTHELSMKGTLLSKNLFLYKSCTLSLRCLEKFFSFQSV